MLTSPLDHGGPWPGGRCREPGRGSIQSAKALGRMWARWAGVGGQGRGQGGSAGTPGTETLGLRVQELILGGRRGKEGAGGSGVGTGGDGGAGVAGGSRGSGGRQGSTRARSLMGAVAEAPHLLLGLCLCPAFHTPIPAPHLGGQSPESPWVAPGHPALGALHCTPGQGRKYCFAVGPKQALGPGWSPCPCCGDPGCSGLALRHLAFSHPGTLPRYFPGR